VEFRGGSRKSVRRWQFIGQGGDHGQNTVFKAYSRQYNPFSFVAAEKKWKKKFMRGRQSQVRRTARSATGGVMVPDCFEK